MRSLELIRYSIRIKEVSDCLLDGIQFFVALYEADLLPHVTLVDIVLNCGKSPTEIRPLQWCISVWFSSIHTDAVKNFSVTVRPGQFFYESRTDLIHYSAESIINQLLAIYKDPK